jgi:PAS domain S-box-containing protein
MGIRKKILITIATVLGAVMSLIYLATAYFLLQNLDQAEARSMKGDAERTVDLFLNEAKNLSTKLSDWSQWDDTYRYVDDRNPEYVESNLGRESLAALGINFIVIIDASGTIVVESGIDVTDGTERPVPDDLRAQFGPGRYLIDHPDLAVSKEGVISLAGGPALVAARPILTSKGEGPSRGTIAFVRLIDSGLMEKLSGLTHSDIRTQWYGSGTVDESFRVATEYFQGGQSGSFVMPESASVIAGYGLLSDIFGEKIMILRIENPRLVHGEGIRSVTLFGIALILFWALAFLLIFFLTEKLVLSKITYLEEAVSRIRIEGRASTNIYLPGTDEFAELAKKINEMVSAIILFREKEETAEQRFEIIAREAPVMIWMADPDKSVNYFNKGWLDFTGRELSREIGRGWMELVHPDDLERTVATFFSSFDERKTFSVECRIRGHDGAYAWILTTGVPYYSEAKVFLGYIGVSIDITDRKEAEEEEIGKLEETERLNAIITSEKGKGDAILRFLRSIGDGVIATDMDGKIIFSNEAAAKLLSFGGSLDGQWHKDVFRVVSEQAVEKEECFIKEVLRKKEKIEGREHRLLVKNDGTKIPISYTAAPILDADGGMLGCIAVIKDTTEEREAERMKDRFLSVSAHQLRTPLSGMRWSMEMLLGGDLGKLPREAKDMIDRIHANTVRMIVLVGDLLDVSRINEGNYMEKAVPMDIAPLVKEVVEGIRSEADDHRVMMTFEQESGMLPLIVAAPKRLYEVIENLLSNAIKYTDADGTVTATLRKSERGVTLSVTDTGIGIPEREQEKIFSKFFRASNAMRKNTEGSGLGLSVARSFVEEIGGRVWFESEEGKGTTFFVEIPSVESVRNK